MACVAHTAGAGMNDQPHATLLTSLRGWACGFASRAEHNTHSCAYNSRRIAPAPPSRETSGARIIRCTMRRWAQLRRLRLSHPLLPGPRARPGQCARQHPRHPSRQRPRISPSWPVRHAPGLPGEGMRTEMVLAADEAQKGCGIGETPQNVTRTRTVLALTRLRPPLNQKVGRRSAGPPQARNALVSLVFR